MITSLRAWLWLGIPLFAAAVAFIPADNAAAQGKKSAVATLSDVQLAESIHTLRVARLTLEAADHDYGGHRADAVRDISAAVKQLKQALEAVHKGKLIPKGDKKKVAAGKEPQAISDTQLASTIPALEQTSSLLRNATIDYGGHRTQAIADLDSAVKQLKTALKYSKDKNQDK